MTMDQSSGPFGPDAPNVIDPRATEMDIDGQDVGDIDAEAPKLTVEERFGQAIMRLRLYRGWSQRDLQRGCGVHQSQISRLEAGQQRGLSSRRLFAILKALHVGEIAFLPPVPKVPPTELERVLWGDPWERAGRAAERRRVNRRRSA